MLRRILETILLLAVSHICFAQAATEIKPSNDTGLRPLTPYSTGGGNVNLTNGNLNLEIPLVPLPGRAGMSYTLSLTYDSKIWVPRATYSSPIDIIYTWSDGSLQGGSGDWHLNVPSITQGPWLTDGSGNHSGNGDYVVTLMGGAKHALGKTDYFNFADWSRDAEDGSGLNIDLSNSNDIVVRSKDGTAYHFGNGTSDLTNIKVEDTNGNSVLFNNSGLTDTLGRTIAGVNYGHPPQSINYRESDGTQRTITLTYTNITILTGSSPHFSYPVQHTCNGAQNCTNIYVVQPSNVVKSVLSTLTLADGSQYAFSYNDYGELSKIVFPTGGYAKYEYAAYQHQETFWNYASGTCDGEACLSLNIKSDFREINKKSVCSAVNGTCPAEEVTVYMPSTSASLGSNSANTVYEGVTDSYLPPQSFLRRTVNSFTTCDQSDSNFSRYCSPHDAGSATYEYGGSTPVKSTTIAYNTYGSYPFLPMTITTSLNGGPASTEQLSYDTQTVHVMRPLGADYSQQTLQDVTMPIDNVTQDTVFDYGKQPGTNPSLRKVVNTYLKSTPYTSSWLHILNRKTEEQIYDGSNNLMADTQYEYDTPLDGIAASGATCHDTSVGNYGNVSAIKRWRNTDGAWLATKYRWFDDAGNVLRVEDHGGHQTQLSYADSWESTTAPLCSPSGQTKAYLTQVTNALGYFTSASYNSCTGTMHSFSDLNSQTTTWTYDLLGRMTDILYPDQGEIQLSYPNPNTVNRRQKQDASTWITNSFALDGRGRVVQSSLTSDLEGTDITDTAYDALGRVYSVSNPYRSGDTTYYTYSQYDALDRARVLTRQDGNTVQSVYSGPTTTVTDETGRPRKSVTDALGRLTSVIEPNPDTGSFTTGSFLTQYTYDALGNLLTVNQQGDGSGSARNRSFTYNSLSQLLTASNPESGTISYSYDNDGLLYQKVDARGKITSHWYDELHRLTAKTYYADSTPTPRFLYDVASVNGVTVENPIGRLVRATTDDGTGTINSYDEMGRVKLQYQWVCVMGNCSSTQTISENHDFAGNPTSLGYPSGRNLVLSYNAAARPLSVADGDETAYVSDATYAPQGALSGYLNGKSPSFTGIAHAFSYNSRLQADSIAVQTPTAMIFGLSYGYGTSNNGNVMQVTNTLNPGRTQTFTYDKLNRLTSAYSNNSSGVESWGNAYGYDAWGNLLHKGSIIGLQREYVELFDAAVDPDHLNRLSGYGYDASGNVTQNGAASYGYDAEGRMVSAGNANYTYDAQGRRVAKSDGTQYFYAPSGDVIAERSATGTWSDYIFFGGKRVARRVASGTYYYVSDHLGTARLITQADGTVCYEAVYYPWGVEQHVLTDTCPQNYKFTGKERDSETGLDYFGARYYGSTMGRWLSPDWSGGPTAVPYADFGNPQSLNLYSYVGNNPLARADADGHCWHWLWGGHCKEDPPSPPPPPAPQTPPVITPGTPQNNLANAQDAARADPNLQPTPPGPGRKTFCNIATCQIVRNTGTTTDALVDKNGTPNLANTDAKTLANSPAWKPVSAQEAQNLANQGVTVVGVIFETGHGHIVTVRPELLPGTQDVGRYGPLVNNIGQNVGVTNGNKAFEGGTPQYYAPVNNNR